MKFGGLKRLKNTLVKIAKGVAEGGSKMANFGARLADVGKPISSVLTKFIPGGEALNYIFQRAPDIIRAEGTALHKIGQGENVIRSIGGYFNDIKNVLTN